MARFTNIPPITGTIGPICIYKMYGQYYLRTRSSLTGKRVKKDPAFRKTMEYAHLLAKASRIGSTVYAALPADQKQHSLYRKLTGEAMYWLKHQWSTEDVLDFLLKLYTGQEILEEAPPAKATETVTVSATAFRRNNKAQQLRSIEWRYCNNTFAWYTFLSVAPEIRTQYTPRLQEDCVGMLTTCACRTICKACTCTRRPEASIISSL